VRLSAIKPPRSRRIKDERGGGPVGEAGEVAR
jgi:hypothetical protein